MVQAANPRHGDDCAASALLECRPIGGCLLVEPEVRTVLMVVAHIFIHQPIQMALVHHNHMIDQVAPAACDESFGNSILLGASNLDSNQSDTQVLRRFQNLVIERVLAIKHEKLWRGVVRKSLP